jgi:hypothetical protein
MFQLQFVGNPDGVYIAGQTLSGKLQLHLLKEKAVQGNKEIRGLGSPVSDMTLYYRPLDPHNGQGFRLMVRN